MPINARPLHDTPRADAGRAPILDGKQTTRLRSGPTRKRHDARMLRGFARTRNATRQAQLHRLRDARVRAEQRPLPRLLRDARHGRRRHRKAARRIRRRHGNLRVHEGDREDDGPRIFRTALPRRGDDGFRAAHGVSQGRHRVLRRRGRRGAHLRGNPAHPRLRSRRVCV